MRKENEQLHVEIFLGETKIEPDELKNLTISSKTVDEIIDRAIARKVINEYLEDKNCGKNN